MARWLPAYQTLIEAGASFPPDLHAADAPAELRPIPAGFPAPGHATHSPAAAATGPGPSAPPPHEAAAAASDPRIPPGPMPLSAVLGSATGSPPASTPTA
jgi:hypothetical protein